MMTIKTETRNVELRMQEWTENGYGPDFLADLLDKGSNGLEMTDEELDELIEWCEQFAKDFREGNTDTDYNPEGETKDYYFSIENI